MFKKITTTLAAIAVTLALAGNALAAFADLELIRVYYDRNGSEIATDLGTVGSLIASSSTIPGSFGTLSTGFAVYFALDRSTNRLWTSGSTTTPSVINGTNNGLTSLKSGSTFLYNWFNATAIDNTYTGLASAQNSYKNKLSATQGNLAASINNASRLSTEASLTNLITDGTGSVTQTLYFWDNALTTVAAEKIGVPVATITTNADGSTTISPPVAVNGACGTADGQAMVAAPTSNLCSSGSATVVSGEGPWNWACNGQNGGTNASCSATVFQNTTTPNITWATPAPITYGTVLSATQYNATATDPATSASVPGTFTPTPDSPAIGTVLNAGTQTLTGTFTPTDTANYTTATATVSLQVNKAVLAVTADNLSKTTGTPNPPLTYTPSGFKNNDTAAVISGSAALSTTATTASPAGTYPITATAGTLTAANYSFTFISGTLTVTDKLVPTITWPTPTAITYGTPLSATQLNATANVPGAFVYEPIIGTLPNAGTQTLSVTFTPTDIATYTTKTATVSLVVNKAVLTIKADDLSKTYGDANPALTFTVSGFVNGDSAAVQTGSPALSTTATTSSPVGTYPVTATAGTLTAANYSFAFANGTLTVNKAVLTIKADDLSKSTGSVNPTLTYTATGFVNDDTSSVLTGSPALSTTATTSSPAGTYPITATAGTLAAANYSFTYASGALTVTADATAPTITAFTVPASVTSLTVTGINLTASDNQAVTGYLLTETNTQPTTSATGWTATAPTSYSFTTGGSKTLWAWARDAAGNVSTISANSSASVTVNITTYPSGDANGDGIVEISDALKTLRYVVGLETLSSTQWTNANVAPLSNGLPNPNTRVDIGDALVILEKIVGLVSW